MGVIRLTARADAAGVIQLSLPAGSAGTEYDLQIVLTPKPAATGPAGPKTPEDLGWPPGYFENTAGVIQDPAFDRGEQGWYEQREPLE